MQELQCFVGRTNTTSFQTQTAQKQVQNSMCAAVDAERN